MSLPFFYIDSPIQAAHIVLNEETSKHIGQVLRMQSGEQIHLTDGYGNLYLAEITDNHRKKCSVSIIRTQTISASNNSVTIAISLIKNASRFEWFIEKATELGVTEIIPLLCDRTEKQSFKIDRIKTIAISAMLQSKQCYLPQISEPIRFKKIIEQDNFQQKFIAHCEEGKEKKQLSTFASSSNSSSIILIGPEGDFSIDEIQTAIQNNFVPVSLGDTRLRTETAGVAAAALLCLV